MQDWFLADWGDPALDRGHLKHREIAGMQVVGLHIDGGEQKTSNFMEHGTLAVKIRQEDYRSFLLTLYAWSALRQTPAIAIHPRMRCFRAVAPAREPICLVGGGQLRPAADAGASLAVVLRRVRRGCLPPSRLRQSIGFVRVNGLS